MTSSERATRVEFARTAVEALDELILTHRLPKDTRQRLKRRLVRLELFPLSGPELTGRWAGTRFMLGPWRWMVIVYEHDAIENLVTVLTIEDARTSTSPTRFR